MAQPFWLLFYVIDDKTSVILFLIKHILYKRKEYDISFFF